MNIIKSLYSWLTGEQFIMYMGGGGGGPNTTYSQTSNIPEYAQPYVEQMLGAAQKQVFDYNEAGEPTTMKGFKPFNPDPNAYFTGFQPMQTKAQEGVRDMTLPGEYGQAASATQQGMQNLQGANYQGSQFGNQFRAPGEYQPGQFSMVQAQAPELQNYQMQGPQDVRATGYDAAEMGAAQTAYNPNLQQYQMGPAERVRTQSFARPGSAEAFMSPYMQSVVDVQQAAAQRQADIARTGRGAQAVQSGAFGGSRQAIMDAEANRALADQQGAIQAQGLQSAYGQAQQQFNAEQQARLQAQLANQQAGLTVGGQNLGAQLGIQQLGTQTGLQTSLANLSSQQQANVQNQAARNQAMGMNAQQAMQAALANQQMGFNVGSQNLGAQLGIQQLGAGQDLQAQLANQQAFQQAQQAGEQSRQYGAGLGMTAAQQRAQYGLAGQQAAEQSRQFGAGYGLQGQQAALAAANQLADIGGRGLTAQQGIYNMQNQYGGQQQAFEQSKINQQIQDYATAQQYPMMQLGNMNALTRGLPMQSSTTSMYQAPPSAVSQLAGLGTAAYGLSQLGGFGSTPTGKAAGGQIKEKRPAGLAELALMKMQ